MEKNPNNILDNHPKGSQRAGTEGFNLDMHGSNLFDEDETRAGGEKTDLATGEPIDNSTFLATEDLGVRDEASDGSEDIMGSLEEEDDAAAQWLRENK